MVWNLDACRIFNEETDDCLMRRKLRGKGDVAVYLRTIALFTLRASRCLSAVRSLASETMAVRLVEGETERSCQWFESMFVHLRPFVRLNVGYNNLCLMPHIEPAFRIEIENDRTDTYMLVMFEASRDSHDPAWSFLLTKHILVESIFQRLLGD